MLQVIKHHDMVRAHQIGEIGKPPLRTPACQVSSAMRNERKEAQIKAGASGETSSWNRLTPVGRRQPQITSPAHRPSKHLQSVVAL
jgi:hypothetical protein